MNAITSTAELLNVWLLLAVPLAPLLGFVLVAIFGTKFGGNLIGRRASHSICIAGVLIACLLSLYILFLVISRNARFDDSIYTWMQLGNLTMELGFYIDSLSAMMMCVITFVSLMVHIYSMGYMQDDAGYNRFFAYISLFTFSMLMLVMSNNLLQLFFGWEAVGLVSYLLIGFYYKKDSAIFANMKAFLVNRAGDFGFILGIGLLLAFGGSLNYSELFPTFEQLSTVQLPGTGWSLTTVIGICLFIGAMAKSAQFPLHIWLPDSMEGPTPISALIHAATMVTAGIFLVCRFSGLYETSDVALNFMLLIGAITALFMGFLGIIQDDIKRVIAYSTISQLGYMVVALGVSAYSVAAFHLLTHAFFKALLFLGAGSVIMGLHHNQDIRWMGGVRKYMPITWLTFLLGNLALIGTPFFSGFYSKDAIIEATAASHLPAAGFAYFAVLAGVFITAFYSFRLYFLVFHGKPRYDQNPHRHDSDEHQHDQLPHESPLVVTVPLILLAIPSVGLGYLLIMPLLFGRFFDGVIHVDQQAHHAMTELKHHIHSAWEMTLHAFSSAPLYLALAGVLLAWYCYLINPALPAWIKQRGGIVYRLLQQKYYLDWINENLVAAGGRWLGMAFWRVGDQSIIDGGIVNGSWRLVGKGAKQVARLQSGYLYQYALLMLVGLVLLIGYFVSWPMVMAWFNG